MNWHRRALIVLLGVVVFASGCATLGTLRDVSVSVVNIVPTQTALLETSAALTLRLTNETAQPLTLAGSSHRVYVNDTYVGRAVSDERLTVPALSTATHTVTVHLENLALLRKATDLSANEAPVLAYRVESQLHPADGFRRLRATATGELDVGAFMSSRPAPSPARR